MGRKRTNFEESALMNKKTYTQYYNRLKELSTSMFEWLNLPDSVNPRYLELKLFERGSVVFFRDYDLEGGKELCLECVPQGRLGVYGDPIRRRAYSGYNNYSKELDESNSVIIWNNYLHINSQLDVEMFARRLAILDRIIDVNAGAQKTPVMIQGSEQQRLSLINLYKEYDGNAPVIFGDSSLDLKSLTVLKTDAPYVADKIYMLKTQIWNEALTYLGISNINVQKKERLITDEVTRNQGGTIASRYSRLQSRREAVEKINEMFGLNIEVNYREDFQQVSDDNTPEEPGADTIGGVGNE